MKKYLILLATCLTFSLMSCNKNDKTSNWEDEEVVEIEETFPIYLGNFNLDKRPDFLSERELDYDDIRGLSKAELRVLRNAIFALHNRKFSSDDLQDYFQMFSWYSPMYNDYQISLNSTEMANVSFISRYE